MSALAVTLWGVPVAAEASPAATVVHCGQTLTTSTRIANDLVNCPGSGLIIGAAHITVDLNGHTMSGSNAPGSEGIADDGHAGVRIVNGTIQRFFLNGVGLRHAPPSAVCNLTIREIGAGGAEPTASAGVLVKNSAHSSVTSSRVTNDVKAFQSDGVDVLSSAGTLVSGNRLVKNNWNGRFLLFSPGSRVTSNSFDGSGNQGIEVNLGSDRVLLSHNHAGGNGQDGMAVGAISGGRIEHNRLIGNRDTGLFMFDLHKSQISDNRATGNVVGIDLEGGQNGSAANYLLDNDTSRNSAAGIVVADRANRNHVVGNVSNANQGPPGEGGGIIVFAASGNVLRANTANHNLDLGIGVFEDQPGQSTGNILKANVANANRAHGISVVSGNHDGGGNTATGNTPLPNCIGVSC